MVAEKIGRFRDRITFITGGSKNAGKTTFLNFLLPSLRKSGEFAFLTIGIDGEKRDLIYGNEKPAIYTEEGDYLVTTEKMLEHSPASFRILHVFPWKTVLGKLLLLKTQRGGFVELAGAESNDQLGSIIGEIRENRGIRTVLVDGAVNRITQVAAGDGASFYYVMKVNPENLNSAIDKIHTFAHYRDVPLWAGETGETGTVSYQGAFTSRNLREIKKGTASLVIDDFTRLFLSSTEFLDLKNKVDVFFRHPFHLEGLIINLQNIDRIAFLEKLGDTCLNGDIIFNPYERRSPE